MNVTLKKDKKEKTKRLYKQVLTSNKIYQRELTSTIGN